MDMTKVRRAKLKEWFSSHPIPEIEKSYISQLINGKASFGEKAARRLEATYGMGYRHLEGEGDSANDQRVEIAGWVPLISWVQAGEWAEAVDLYEPGYAERALPTTVPHSMQTFALRVDGDSMTLPEGVQGVSFPHGMIIYVDPQREALTGDYVVARHNGHRRVTFKRLQSEEGRPVLVPLNPDRGQYPVIRDEFEILGRVIDASWGGL